ncbi:c-type cytochrome biogenesis protein CcsB [Desulfobacterales bacterium HSG2]|nr:c-type cytochrome biogenesis protein CcsB [Desulfobacterales bacterium HSG2]
MEVLIIITILFYMLSTAGYIAYLFLQKDYLNRSGYYLLAAGFFCHSAALIYGFVRSGHLPVYTLHETLFMAGWTIAGVFLVFQYKFNVKVLGAYAAPLATIVMLISSQLPREPAQAKNIFNSFWVSFHVIVIFIGEAAFALACGVGLLYLIQEYSIKNKSHGFFFRRLPSLELLDATGYTCIISGFTMLTLGLITGFLYAKLAWGRFWSWDPKEVWSGITWLLYAALLHGRFALGWRGRKAAIMSAIGFAALLFTFLGVNLFLKGHHGEFTRW